MSVKTILEGKKNIILYLSETDSVVAAAKKMADAAVGSILIFEKDELVGIFTERDLLRLCATSHDKLDSILLKDVMTKNLTVASADDSVDDVIGTMIAKKFRHMPVMEGDKILGLVSIGDAIKDKMNKAIEEANMLKQYIHGS